MNYQKHYNLLIKRGKDRNLSEGFEEHHIVPEYFFINRKRKGPKGWLEGNPESIDNLVKLTFEEHYTAHLLLTKIYPDKPGLFYAAKMMTSNLRKQRANNKLYGWLKRRLAELPGPMKGKKNPGLSESNRKRKGTKTGPHTEERKKNISKSRKKGIEKGAIVLWNKGIKTGPQSENHKANISKATKGKTAGVPKSEEHKKNMRKPQKVITCPKCGKRGGNIMKKHHFDNCKVSVE